LKSIPTWVEEHKAGVILSFELLFVGIVAVIVASLVAVPAAIATAIAGILLVFTKLFETDIVNSAKIAFNSLPGKLEGIKGAMDIAANLVATSIGGIFGAAFNGIKTAYNNLSTGFGTPSVKFAGGDIGGTRNFTIDVPHAATGAIVDRNQLVNVGEGNRKEAIFPLTSEGLRPFAQILMSELGLGGTTIRANQNSQQLQPLYVGTLIADDRGLKELERKMQVIRMSENQRKGVNG
jgi:SLT domain-containing protein